ncbi:MAG: leucyl/phenylalanyl-tRNA--protein transferase [bacterium]|jgi:leucyl/phenylalanyl-tRNA--protein transferase|nr:leucyl/phenylalanyl-tRNA--protein transferase [Gammaproteobacteria bacterium]|tara:strand:+ start:2277 stop:2984 length:708 start_codon:yes stop_codon:yes gene_type:complete
MSALVWLSEDPALFPDIDDALTDPNGLLAVGGDLSEARLIAAYRQGIFPWFDDDQPILWWSPDSRCVIDPTSFSPSRSLAKRIRKADFELRIDDAFSQVIDYCQLRSGDEGTWITDEMKAAYLNLHDSGFAHSFECYINGTLCGGLYGLSIGNLFFGESMFHHVTDASKLAFTGLMKTMANAGCPMVDCQLPNPHLLSLGAFELPRDQFRQILNKHIDKPSIDWSQLRGVCPVIW